MKNTATKFAILGILIVFMAIFAGFLGFGKGGFAERILIEQFWIYGVYGVSGALIIFFLFQYELLITKKDEKYGNYLFFFSPGEFFKDFYKKVFQSPFLIILLTLIFSITMGFIANFYGQTYFGVGTLEQQFTTTDGVLYNWFLVATAENLGAAAFAAFLVFSWRFFAKKYNIEKASFIVIAILLVIFAYTSYGLINHQLRYSAQETAIEKVAGFWALMGLGVALSGGNFLVGWILHGVNNTYVELNKIFTNDQLIVYVVFLDVILVVLAFWYYSRLRKNV